jgi:formylmethanofuran dehydrogenase subunit E
MHSWKFECESCKEKFMDELSVQTHQASLGHEGIIVLGLMKENYAIGISILNIEDSSTNSIFSAEEMNPLDFVAVVSELDADANEGQEVECPECQKPFISSKTLMVPSENV